MSCHQSSFTILATWVFFYHFRTRVWLSLHLFVICWLWYFLDFSYFQWKFIFLSLSFEPELFSKRSQIPNVLYNKTSSFYRSKFKHSNGNNRIHMQMNVFISKFKLINSIIMSDLNLLKDRNILLVISFNDITLL